MIADIEFWGVGTARTLRPIWMAEELGLDYTLHPIGPRTGETQSAAFTKLSRKQKIPFMQIGDVRLSESLAICRYMQKTFPVKDAFVVPQDDIAYAKQDEWCCYIYGELDETALYVMRRHYDLTEIYGDAPQAVETCRAYLQRHFVIIDTHLANHRTVLADGFGLADIMLVSCLDWAAFYGVQLPKHISAYRDHIAERPAYKKAMGINYAALKEVLGGAA